MWGVDGIHWVITIEVASPSPFGLWRNGQEALDDPRGPDFLVFVNGGGFLDKDDKTKFRPGFRTRSTY